MEIRGRRALVTGAAGGIGSAVVRNLAGHGMTVVATDLNQDALDALIHSLPGEGHVALTADLSSRKEASALLGRVEEASGPIDLLVNNAGYERTAVFHEIDLTDLDKILKVNLRAPMILTHAVIPGMLERGHGHVVQMASTAGMAGAACLEPYGATKAGLIRFNESLRATYRGKPVGFSAICPGWTKGGGMFERMRARGNEPPATIGSTTAEEVAEAVTRAVTKNLPLVMSNSRPVRPMTVLTTLTPRLAGRVMELTGANKFFRTDAKNR